MGRDDQILKAVLLLRKTNRYTTKEEQISEVKEFFAKGYMTDESLQEWISALKEPDPVESMTEEERERYCEELSMAEWEFERHQYRSCTARDYSPSNPWDAPGMSVRDFI